MTNDAFPLRLAALPFIIAIGFTVGESVAGGLIGPELPKNNDIAGAGYAIMGLLTFAAAFGISLITIVIRAVMRRQVPARIALRAVGSVIIGGVIGALSFSQLGNWTGLLTVPLLMLAPIGLAISWPGDDFYH